MGNLTAAYRPHLIRGNRDYGSSPSRKRDKLHLVSLAARINVDYGANITRLKALF
jgi:hypothetical protein